MGDVIQMPDDEFDDNAPELVDLRAAIGIAMKAASDGDIDPFHVVWELAFALVCMSDFGAAVRLMADIEDEIEEDAEVKFDA